MSEFTDGIQFAIDSIEGVLDNQALDVIPSQVALRILMAGLKNDIEDFLGDEE